MTVQEVTKPETVTMLLILLVFFESLFFYRLLVARPYALVTPLVVIVIAAALQRRHWLIAAALAASVLLSHLFVFPLFVAGACVIWRFTLGERRTAAAVAAWSAGGVAAGFLLHPHPLPYLL